MKNQAVILTVGISLIVFGAIIWYINSIYLPAQKIQIENFYAQEYVSEKVFVVNNQDGIYSDTVITEDLFNQGSIIAIDVPKKFLPTDKSSGLLVYTEGEKGSMLRGKVKRALNKGEFILKDLVEVNSQLSDEEEFKKKYQYTIKNTVGGEIKTGSLVDIILDYGNGDYDIVIPKIKIESIVGMGASTDPAAAPATVATTGDVDIILTLDDIGGRDMKLAKKLGTFKVRLYTSEKQAAAKKTFDYTKMLQLINMNVKDQTNQSAKYEINKFLSRPFKKDDKGGLAKDINGNPILDITGWPGCKPEIKKEFYESLQEYKAQEKLKQLKQM